MRPVKVILKPRCSSADGDTILRYIASTYDCAAKFAGDRWPMVGGYRVWQFNYDA